MLQTLLLLGAAASAGGGIVHACPCPCPSLVRPPLPSPALPAPPGSSVPSSAADRAAFVPPPRRQQRFERQAAVKTDDSLTATADAAQVASFEQIVLSLDPHSGGILAIRPSSADAAATWFVRGSSNSALWALKFVDGGSLDSSGCGTPLFSNQSRVITWAGCQYGPSAQLEVTVTWSAAQLPPQAVKLSRLPPAAPFGVEGRIRVRTVDGINAAGQPAPQVAPQLSEVL